jgi:sec-independent protein translocase protein TatC
MRNFFSGLWRVITSPFRAFRWLGMLPIRGIRKVNHFLNEEPEDRPLTDVLMETVAKPSGLLDHIAALRKHFARMLIGLFVCIGIVFIFVPQGLELLAKPIGGIAALKAIDVTESIGVFMKVALLGGVAVASPYLAFELWLFAAPGLKPRARKLGLVSIPLVLVFFLGGMLFAYAILLPPALKFLLNFMGIQVIPRPSTYIGFVTGILFWIGVIFEFPLVVYVLTLMGIVHPQRLLKQWRIAIVVIAVLAAAITPTTDPVNMALMTAPMVALYFISVGLGYLALISRKRGERGEVEKVKDI